MEEMTNLKVMFAALIMLTYISHINPARCVVNSTIATRCSRIAEHSGYHEC